ncbi:DUF1080 domain-containing protein [Puteibacter caeruleilacunae]|nr:DUF1080 domain-containing protein [Puteibacter caeruleilacunae]
MFMKPIKLIMMITLSVLMSVNTWAKGEGKPNTLTPKEVSEGWQLLFDGKTFNNWKAYGSDEIPNAWEITDGTIHLLSRKSRNGKKGGDIITVKEFKNFEFYVEWKIAKGSNSGICYLINENDELAMWGTGPEMQILDNKNHPDAKKGKDHNRQAGSLYDMIPANPQNAKAIGEWNSVRIKIKGRKVQHWQNGVMVVSYKLKSKDWKEIKAGSKWAKYDLYGAFKKGHIGLQDHSDDVWFRNIKIRKI